MIGVGYHPLTLHVTVIGSSSVKIKWAEGLENVGAAPFVKVRTVKLALTGVTPLYAHVNSVSSLSIE